MINEIEEIAKEIDMFRSNLLGLNGIIEHVRIAHEEIKASIDISNKQLAKLGGYSEEMSRIKSDVMDVIGMNSKNTQEQLDLMISSRFEHLSENTKVLLSEMETQQMRIINEMQNNQDKYLQFQSDIYQKIDTLTGESKLFLNQTNNKFNEMKSTFNLLILISCVVLIISVVVFFK